MKKPLNVYIITQNEPFYIPKVIRYILQHQNECFKIVGATVLTPHRKNKSMKDWLLERTKIYTWWELFLVFLLMIWCKILSPKKHTVNTEFNHHKITQVTTTDVNSFEFINRLKNLDIDIILSISPPQLFQKELINLPSKYCINAHGTLLPRHRGVFGSWWTIFNKDKEAGTTLHTIDKNIDKGTILWQQEFMVDQNDTQYSIAKKTKQLIAEGSVDLLQKIYQDKEHTKPVKYNESYHKSPTKEQGKTFHKKKHRVITWQNVMAIITEEF